MPESTIKLDINTFQDIEIYFNRLTKGENIAIGNVAENITMTIKLDGGRFKNYSVPYVNAVIAKVILEQQEAYKRIVKILEKDFNINIFDSEALLQFKLEEGSFEAVLEQASKIVKDIKDMPPKVQIVVISAVLIGWISSEAFSTYNKVMEQNKQVLLQKESNRHTEEIANIIDRITQNTKLEKTINQPKEKILKELNIDETLSYKLDGKTVGTVVSKNEIDKYKVVEPAVEDIEEGPEDIICQLEYYNFIRDGKLFKIKGVGPLANSEPLSVEKRIKLIAEAEKQANVTLRVKYIKDGTTKTVKQMYILDYIY